MKKNDHKAKKLTLNLRREHIRLLTAADLQLAVGGKPDDITDGCVPVSLKNQNHCN